MVALRRLFQAEKGSSTGSASQDPPQNYLTRSVDETQRSRSLNTSLQPGAGQHFQNIEKQFEELHDQMQARPLSSRSYAPSSRTSSRFTQVTQRNPGHVDLLDALFSSHRYQMQTANALSPITPYNEDVAERNMVRFLQGQPRTHKVYSRIVSAPYQEDVADRNIARSRTNNRTFSRSASPLSQGPSARAEASCRGNSSRPRSTAGSQATSSSSRPGSRSSSQQNEAREAVDSDFERPSSGEHFLRAHRSASDMSAEPPQTSQELSATSSRRHLHVPPAHKHGHQWSNTPLPDSPTLPMTINHTRGRSPAGNGQQTIPSDSPPASLRPSSKRNVRDLSINTELAARGKHADRITHRAIQPPTPSSYDTKQNPSIAEVMNSPLLNATPTSLSPLPPSDQKVAVIMDLFRQAYTSPAESISPHPTFETLQDAIVREINSHEAFRGPPPEMSLPFTSTSSQDSLGGEQLPTQADLTRNVPAKEVKESQFSRLIRRTSSKKDRKGSECKSISANVPSVAFGRGSRTVRRRHTDAPPPTPGLLNAKQSGTTTSTSQPEEQVTYIDILLRSQKPSPPTTIGSRRAAEAFRDSGRSQFAGIFTSPSVSDLERPSTTPSAYYMRAQTSESSTDGRSCISADDSDEEVIHLPSVGIPRVQIQAVDENNATYMIENTTPRDAYRLMNWSYNARRSVSSKRNPVLDENKAQQCSEHEHQLQGTRSVESY